MTLCETTAPLVNLVPAETVSDVYQTVAEAAKTKVEVMAADDTFLYQDVAKVVLTNPFDRKLVKRNVMTWAYSSGLKGMIDQIDEDTMEPLRHEVLTGKRETHPYSCEGEATAGYKASMMIGRVSRASIEETMDKPALAMKFLQGISRALSHEGKPVIWHTPLGLPVVLRCPKYGPSDVVSLFLHDKGVPVRTQTYMRVEAPGIDKRDAAQAIAPGFIHSYDACHLQMVVLEAVQQGIHDFALVHDSFGCHAADATRFRKVISQTFFRLYSEYDPLQMIHDEAMSQVETSAHRIPPVPSKGSYDIKEVINAQYAFA
jgi:DNA-directed RNA polymerase